MIKELYNRLYDFNEIYPFIRDFKAFEYKLKKASRSDLDELSKYIEDKRIASIKLKLGRLGIKINKFKFENTLLGQDLAKIKTKPLIDVWSEKL